MAWTPRLSMTDGSAPMPRRALTTERLPHPASSLRAVIPCPVPGRCAAMSAPWSTSMEATRAACGRTGVSVEDGLGRGEASGRLGGVVPIAPDGLRLHVDSTHVVTMSSHQLLHLFERFSGNVRPSHKSACCMDALPLQYGLQHGENA